MNFAGVVCMCTYHHLKFASPQLYDWAVMGKSFWQARNGNYNYSQPRNAEMEALIMIMKSTKVQTLGELRMRCTSN